LYFLKNIKAVKWVWCRQDVARMNEV
jgi:hypothetical protein